MIRDAGKCIYPHPTVQGLRCGVRATGGIDHLTGRTISGDPDYGDCNHVKNLAACCFACHEHKTFEKVRDVMLHLRGKFGYEYSERRYKRYHLDREKLNENK